MLNHAWPAGAAAVVDLAAPSRPLRVAIVGFGVVGRSVARLLGTRNPGDAGVTLTHVFNRNIDRKRVDWVDDSVAWTEQIDDVLASNVDVMVEVIGGLEPAYQWVSAALERGISVVTANKVLIAHHGRALAELAALHGAELRFEASVAGGVPVINAIERGVAGDRLTRVAGILNGTCNYVLSEIASTRGSFQDAVARARELGFAEADPANDLNGSDAAAKLMVLAGVGFHLELRPEHVRRQSIAPITPTDFDYAARLGCTIRQVSFAERRGDSELDAFVGPALVPLDAPLARVFGASNMVVLTGEHGGDVTLSGRGAGGDPTAVAVVSDLLALGRGERRPHGAMWSRATLAVPAPLAYYVRFVVRDRPGILASFAAVFARHRINVDAVLQEPGYPKSRLPFVMTLEPCAQASLAAALEDLDALDVHEDRPLALPRLSGGDDRHAG
jgi:homoserine dehydrogenase